MSFLHVGTFSSSSAGKNWLLEVDAGGAHLWDWADECLQEVGRVRGEAGVSWGAEGPPGTQGRGLGLLVSTLRWGWKETDM